MATQPTPVPSTVSAKPGFLSGLKAFITRTPTPVSSTVKTAITPGVPKNVPTAPLTGPGATTAQANAVSALPAPRPASVPGQTELPLTGQLTPTVGYPQPVHKTQDTSDFLYAVGASHQNPGGNSHT